jgi:hypothetical protein
MSENHEVTYGVDFCAGGKGRRESKAFTSAPPLRDSPDRATHGARHSV